MYCLEMYTYIHIYMDFSSTYVAIDFFTCKYKN